jgi:WD40 repeat protein
MKGHLAIQQHPPAKGSGESIVHVRKIEIQKLPQGKPEPVPQRLARSRAAYQNRGGDWRIEGDELVERELMPECQLVFGNFTWNDYDFTCEAKKIAGNDLVGLEYRVTEAGFGRVMIGAQTNKLNMVGSAHRGSWTEWGRQPGGWENDRWYKLRARLRGTRCECFLDDQLISAYEDHNNLRGAVGLITWSTAVRFRNIRVTDPAGNLLFEGLPDLPAAADQWLPATGNAPDAQLHNLKGHGAPVTAVTFSRDGRHIFSSSDADTFHIDHKGNHYYFVAPASTTRLWDGDSGNLLACSPIRQPVWANHGFHKLALSPTSSQFLSFMRRTSKVQLWTFAVGMLQNQLDLPGNTPGLMDLAFGPDGSKARALTADGAFWEWDLSTKTLARQLPGKLQGVTCAAMAPDGRAALLARAGKPFAEIDLATGQESGGWTEVPGPTLCMAFSPDGSLLLTGARGGRVKVWDVRRRILLNTLQGSPRPVFAVAFSPDGRRALSGGEDQTVRLWDLVGNKQLASFTGHTGAVQALAFSPDGRRAASGSGDYTVRVWRLPP